MRSHSEALGRRVLGGYHSNHDRGQPLSIYLLYILRIGSCSFGFRVNPSILQDTRLFCDTVTNHEKGSPWYTSIYHPNLFSETTQISKQHTRFSHIWKKSLYKVVFHVYVFILRDREREREWMNEWMNEWIHPKQAQHCQHGTRHGTWSHEPWDRDLSWNRESEAYPAEPPRCPQNSFINLNSHTEVPLNYNASSDVVPRPHAEYSCLLISH